MAQLMQFQTRDEIRTALRRWRTDPVAFFNGALGLSVWRGQADILRAAATSSRVAVRSGHKIGKSTAAAGIALWWATTRPLARVILTSSSDRQVKAILWRELRRLVMNARVAPGAEVPLDPATGMRWPDGRDIIGFSTDKPENMGGYSGAELLVIADEASGIPEPIFEAIEGNRAGGAHLLMLGNPTQTSGTFFDAFHSKREFWRTLHISSEETPNASGVGAPISGLATREWVEEKRREWGEDSPLYAVRVRGDFPAQGSDALIALGLVDAATARWNDTPETGRLEIGVDVAEFGDDDSVLFPRRGLRALEPESISKKDAPDVAGAVLAMARRMRRAGEVPRVKVDTIGVGAGVAAILLRSAEVETVRVNSSETATAEGYHNLRAQMWGAANDWLKSGGAFKSDSRLEGELVAPRYKFDAQGRMVLEAKADFKKRLGRSPDHADALVLSIHEPAQAVPRTFTGMSLGRIGGERESEWAT